MLNLSNEAKILIGVGVLTVILLVGGVWLLNRNSNTSNTNVDQSILVKSDSFKTGNGSEKVTVVEFADFQCPGCKVASPALERIASDYKGRVNLVYRHFPLAQHPYARETASFAEAAGAQGKFWEAYKLIFDTQDEWSNTADINQFITKFTSDLKLDETKVKDTMSSSKTAEKIQRDYDDGVKAGVNSTPTVFINGEKLSDFPTYELLKQKIEEKLK